MPTVNDIHQQQQHLSQILIRPLRGFCSNMNRNFTGRHQLSGIVFASLQMRLEQSRTLGAGQSLSTSLPSLQFHKARSLTESRRKAQHYKFNLFRRKLIPFSSQSSQTKSHSHLNNSLADSRSSSWTLASPLKPNPNLTQTSYASSADFCSSSGTFAFLPRTCWTAEIFRSLISPPLSCHPLILHCSYHDAQTFPRYIDELLIPRQAYAQSNYAHSQAKLSRQL
jgi:hypothetical protein